ncbi:MAG: cysteine peptidase family C39 domain-containing protein [bacterium]|nr:cysteine peptidase family C39 domain-containing protein [bacterium]
MAGSAASPDALVVTRDRKGRERRTRRPRGAVLPVPIIEQSASGRCGPACLAMVLRYYGIAASEDDVAARSGCSRRNGVDAESLVDVARSFGCTGAIHDIATIRDLRAHVVAQTPPIVDWFSEDDGHYSVVVGIGRRAITLLDPAFGGFHVMPIRRFHRVWFDFPGEFIRSRDDLCIRRMIIIQPA